MKIFIGADHRGFQYKEKIKKVLANSDFSVVDEGTFKEGEACDYPLIAQKVARQVAKHKDSRGILVCMSGIGQAIAANKVKGAYAALCYNAKAAILSRQHNNANILVLSAMFVKPNQLGKIVKDWLATPFEGGRHLRRFKQIQTIEKRFNG